MLPGREYGLTAFESDFSVFLCDIDGNDIVQEFMDEVVRIREDRSLWYTPIKVFIATGEIGFLHSEQVIIYVYAGIPYILTNVVAVDGSDERDPSITGDGEQFISMMFSRNNHTVHSIGFVEPGTDILRYADEYIKANSVMGDPTIDESVANMTISSQGLKSVGAIYRPGGHRYDVYCVDESVSRSIRPMKDFRFNPMQELGVPDGKVEVLLSGGFPEIVPLGTTCTMYGTVFTVWVPNDSFDYRRAAHIFESDWLPNDIFDVDLDDLSETYALLCARATELDMSNNLDGESVDESDFSPPTEVVTVD